MNVVQLYALMLNTIIAISVLAIAIYAIKSYNTLVMLGAPNTNAPVQSSLVDRRPATPTLRPDKVEVEISFKNINEARRTWLEAGYSVSKAHRVGDKMHIIMTRE